MKALRLALLCVVCVAFGGCGLLWVPDPVTIPHRSLRRIVVVDRETMLPIPDATVECSVGKWGNWLSRPPYGSHLVPEHPAVEIPDNVEPDEDCPTWQARAEDGGVFTIEPRTKFGWTRVFFPVPTPLGWFLRKSYTGYVSVSAPGYDGIAISNDEAVLGKNAFGCTSPGVTWPRAYYEIGKESTLVMLHRSGQPHGRTDR